MYLRSPRIHCMDFSEDNAGMLHHLVNFQARLECAQPNTIASQKWPEPVNQIFFKLKRGLVLKARPLLKQEVVAHV